MRVYEAHTIFHGLKLGKEFSHVENVVAVPKNKGFTHVRYVDTVNKLGKPLVERHFKDKFRKDTFYTLEYYEFTPEYDLFIGDV